MTAETMPRRCATTPEETVRTITVIRPKPVPATETITLPGNIMGWYEAPIYARVTGYVKMWYKRYGDRVQKGDLLAEISTPDLDAEYRQAKADLKSERARYKLAEVTAKRWVALRHTQSVSEQSITVQEQHMKTRERYKVTDRIEARVLAWTTKHKPGDGSTHWSSRKLAAELSDLSHMPVTRIWAKHGIKPHRLEGYLASNDPAFETKAAEVIGLYLNPPQHAAVDEKTAIQALDRKDPVLPLSPGRVERHGFEYFRHGTLSLYAAFNTKTGEVLGKTAARHTWAECVAFLTDIVTHQPTGKEIHVIADTLSAHKTTRVKAFLAEHTNVHLHFTPTYSSWLNQVELWFAKIERDVIARGVFTSVSDLQRKLMRYIRHYNTQPKPAKWKYVDPSRRITPESIVTVH